MSTDRELLELAARAAGVPVFSYIDSELFGRGINTGATEGGLWNPLTDDGDALRLAVALHLDIEQRRDQNGAFVWRIDKRVSTRAWAKESECGGDILAATRLAIVRAAAEIGRAM